jgi:type I restriction enzyme M protein
MQARALSLLYRKAHDAMRSIDGLQPQEAFDELLKYLMFRQAGERECDSEFVLRLAGDATGQPRTESGEALRAAFEECGPDRYSAARGFWRDHGFRLSDRALSRVHELFAGVPLSRLDLDIRSVALRSFLSPELRRGLGIYLTPDIGVRMMVEFLSPEPDSVVYDPACGSGTFLIETVRHWRQRRGSGQQTFDVWGTDVSPRMLLLAELNLLHLPDVRFHRAQLDFLANFRDGEMEAPAPGSVDVILTNPPFGVKVAGAGLRERYDTATSNGHTPSEILFLERCLRTLKPGGRLGIVLPRSVVTNARLAGARAAIDRLGHVYAVVHLPPETFALAGTQTTTCVLFFRRHLEGAALDARITIPVARLTNIGVDATGRERKGDQLPQVASQLHRAVETGEATELVELVPDIPAQGALTCLGQRLVPGSSGRKSARRLGDVVESAGTGRTPARSAYTEEGLFILKVGNLTGHGIDWTPRDRNFVDNREEAVRRRPASLLVREGDIVLTASAHSPVYIARKVDIVRRIPAFAGGEATFVAELMRLRVREGEIDPYVLVAYLRAPDTTLTIQRMIRGQTAHLKAEDLLELELPDRVLRLDDRLRAVRDLIVRETELVEHLNAVCFQQMQLLAVLQ